MDKKELTYELKIKAIIEEAQKNLSSFEKQLKDTWEHGAPPKYMSKSLEGMRARLLSLQEIAKKGMVNRADLAMAESDYKALNKAIHDLQIEFKLLTVEQKKAMLSEEEQKAMNSRTAAIKAYNQELQKNREILEKRKPIEQQKAELQQKQQPARRTVEASLEVYGKHKEALVKNGPTLSSEAKAYEATLQKQAKLLEEIKTKETIVNNLRKAGRREDRDNKLTETIKELEVLQKEYKTFESMAGKSEYDRAMAQYNQELDTATRMMEEAKTEISALDAEIEVFDQQLGKLKLTDTKKSLADLKKELKELGVEGIDDIDTIEGLEKAVEELNGKALKQVDDNIEKLGDELEGLAKQSKEAKKGIDDTTASLKQQEQAVASTEAFAAKIKQFVGLAGAAQILSKALRSSFEATKELDAVMTEMAVVTDLRVGDYWEQLPEHTDRASTLGVAIKDVYEAETLYYQQGLKTNEVTAMSTETLKMARIAGLSAEDATNKMTAALRGFNMELNETSAQRVADVYSELAAITASDVNEISSAMTKTASIASSAGMEFETTAAFLSQIIETTRESAETAGTAMKTVIARFQELKKSPDEIGEVDGEIVDANKIETALRSVGVSLRDADGQFRALDEVFLELSSKWDSLDTNTQRYIATIAAGSRQQSRFIAMMSDYGRTQELVNAANTSAGASNKQYEKTLDSLQSKLEKLKNAWTSFTQGIANSKLIKAGVDLLTKLLTTINKITDAFGDFSGAAKITLLIAALYLGDKAIKVFMSSITESKSAFTAMGAVATKTFGTVKQDLHNVKLSMEQFAATVSFAKDKIKASFSPEQTEVMNSYKQAINQLTQAEEALVKAEKTFTKDSEQYRNAMNQKAFATENLKNATDRLERELKLSEQELKDYQMLISAGISADTAAIAVKNKKVMAILREKAALEGLNGELDENTLKTTLNNMSDSADGMGNMVKKIDDFGAKLKGLDKTKALDWFKNLGGALKKLGQGLWNIIKLVLNFIKAWAGAIAMIAVAVVAIIGLIKYIQHLQKTSPEGKLKSAQEAAERAAEAADRASESYQELSDSLESLDDKYKGLEELTKGTKEWKKAVQEINAEVLDLIDKYPELAKYYETVDGVFQVREGAQEKIDEVLNQASLEAAQMQSAELAAKQRVALAENDVAYKNLSGNAKNSREKARNAVLWSSVGAGAVGGAIGGGYGGAAIGTAGTPVGTAIGTVIGAIGGAIAGGIVGGVGAHAGVSALQSKGREQDKKDTEKIAKAAASGEFNLSDLQDTSDYLQREFQISAEAADQWAEQLTSASGELVKFGESLNAADEQIRAYNEAQAAAALNTLNLSSYGGNDQAYIANAANADAYATQLEQATQEVETEFKDKDEAKAAKEQVAKSMYGEDAIVKGNKITYKDGDEEKTIELSNDEFKANYAAMKATEDMAEALKLIPGIVQKVGTSLGQISGEALAAYQQAMKDPSKLTQGQTDALSDISEKELTNIYNNLNKQQQDYYGDLEGFLDSWKDNIKDSQNKFKEANKLISSYSKNIGELNRKFTGDAAVTYTKNLQKMNTALEGNDEQIGKVNESINQIANGLTAEEFNSFISLWNSFDQSDLKAWEDFEESLKDVGLESVLTTQAFRDMSEATKELRGAVYKVDFNALQDSLSNMFKTAKNLKNSGERKVDADTYDMLVQIDETLASSFVRLGDDFHYLGSSVEDLVQTLQAGMVNELKAATQQRYSEQVLYNIAQQANKFSMYNGEVTKSKSEDEWLYEQLKEIRSSEFYMNYGVTESAVKLKYPNAEEDKLGLIADSLTQEEKDKINRDEKEALRELYSPDLSSAQYQVGTYTSAEAQKGVTGFSDEQLRGYIGNFLATTADAVIEDDQLGANILSFLENSDLTFGMDLLALSTQELKDAAESIWKFSQEDGAEKDRLLQEAQRNEAIGLKTLNSASINQERLKEQDITTETGRETAGQYYRAIQIQAQDAGVISQEANTRFADLVKKFEDGTITESQTEELNNLRENMVEHLTLIEQEQQGLSAITSIEQRVLEALVSQRQKEIDKLSNINDSINNASAAMITKIQEQIDEARQERENEKTEQEIGDDQSRLAYLMADTSGANQLGAKALGKEITEKQENYQDQLIDQGLQKLSDDNAAAAEQRERQIALMEAQLEHDQESGNLAREAERITQDSLADINNGVSPLDTEMGLLISEEEDWGSKTVAEQKLLQGELVKAGTSAATAITQVGTTVEYEGDLTRKDIPAEEKLDMASVNKATGHIAKILEEEYGAYDEKTGTRTTGGNVEKRESAQREAIDSIRSSNGQLAGASLKNSAAFSQAYENYKSAGGTMSKEDFYQETVKRGMSEGKYDWYGIDPDKVEVAGLNDAENKWFDLTIDGYKDTKVETGSKQGDTKRLTELYEMTSGASTVAGSVLFDHVDERLFIYGGSAWYEVLDQGADLTSNEENRPNNLINKALALKPYKTGGLADFTGPAWLDGTKSHPELVLNARDTQNFIQLKDILSEIMDGTNTIGGEKHGAGDNYFNIDINVEELKDDYDVEQLANKIRSMLYEDATYRNVNAVSYIR